MNESTMWYLAELEDELTMSTIDSLFDSVGNDQARQVWPVISADSLIKEYRYFRDTKQAHAKNIERFQRRIIRNYVQLWINTVICGHSELSPYEHLSRLSWKIEEMTEPEFETWLNDTPGPEWFFFDDSIRQWRISDYAFQRLTPWVAELIESDEPEHPHYNDLAYKLYCIDQFLSVTHQRGDLAAWFVEDGTYTLNLIFNLNP